MMNVTTQTRKAETMTTTHEIKSNNEQVRLVVKSQTIRRQVADLSGVKPEAIQAAARMALTTKNPVYVASVGGQPQGEPNQQEASLAGCKIGDGRAVIRHLGNNAFEIIAEQVVDAVVYRNGSAARSLQAVNRDGKWEIA